jgi:predicted transporter
MFGVASRREAWKLPAMAYFLAMSVSMVGLLTSVVQVSYQLNQKLTVYGVSIVLIILFTFSVVFAQERWLKQKRDVNFKE